METRKIDTEDAVEAHRKCCPWAMRSECLAHDSAGRTCDRGCEYMRKFIDDIHHGPEQ